MSDLERELGLSIPKLGTLEIEGVPIEGGAAVVQINAEVPMNGAVLPVKLLLTVENARAAFEAGLNICSVLEEQFS